jgi:hypothetical protein
MMKKHLFFSTLVLYLLCNPGVRSQDTISRIDLVALSRKSVESAAKMLREEVKDFDRKCFLLGTMDDNMGHYQTFTANKSLDDVDESVKWIFDKEAAFMPDTMAYRRITTYATLGNGSWHIDLAQLAVSLFGDDYADLRALRVCNRCCPTQRHYGSEIESIYDPEDPICKGNPEAPTQPPYEIELYSSSLAKEMACYYHFDYEKPQLPVVSSGGDIGYRGVINRDKIATEAQKLSFLTGVFMRYGCGRVNDQYGSGCYSICIPNSLSAAAVCAEILREMGCEQVAYIDKFPYGHQIFFTLSAEVGKVIRLKSMVFRELQSNMIAF